MMRAAMNLARRPLVASAAAPCVADGMTPVRVAPEVPVNLHESVIGEAASHRRSR